MRRMAALLANTGHAVREGLPCQTIQAVALLAHTGTAVRAVTRVTSYSKIPARQPLVITIIIFIFFNLFLLLRQCLIHPRLTSNAFNLSALEAEEGDSL